MLVKSSLIFTVTKRVAPWLIVRYGNFQRDLEQDSKSKVRTEKLSYIEFYHLRDAFVAIQ